MKFIFSKYSFLFLLIAFGGASCTEHDLKTTMVELDKSFIPVLYFIKKSNLNSAGERCSILLSKAEKIEDKYAYLHNTPERNESIRKVIFWLEETACAIEDKDELRALVQVDHARYELMDLRRIEQIDYYLDKVWDFEAATDIAVCTAEDALLGLYDWVEFETQVAEVSNAWVEVISHQPDQEWVNNNPSLLNHHNKARQELNQSLVDFRNSVACADAVDFNEKAQILQRRYLDFISVFGDFQQAGSGVAFSGT